MSTEMLWIFLILAAMLVFLLVQRHRDHALKGVYFRNDVRWQFQACKPGPLARLLTLRCRICAHHVLCHGEMFRLDPLPEETAGIEGRFSLAKPVSHGRFWQCSHCGMFYELV